MTYKWLLLVKTGLVTLLVVKYLQEHEVRILQKYDTSIIDKKYFLFAVSNCFTETERKK